MMRTGFVLLVVLGWPLMGHGQFSLTFHTGYGSYNQTELKDFQKESLDDYPVTPKVTESFPSYWYYNGAVRYTLERKYGFGVSVEYGSSAARTSYKDYSGEIRTDMLVNYVAVGLPFDLCLNPGNTAWQFNLQLTPAAVFSTMTMSFHSQLGTQKDDEAYDFKSENMSLQPAFNVTRRIGAFGVNVLAGYNVTVIKGDLLLKHRDAFLQNEAGDKVRMDWSGMRLAVGLSYTFGRRD
ncbi:MAG TPA: hypothetical protein VIU12_02415 [Chryseolinea sp.]